MAKTFEQTQEVTAFGVYIFLKTVLEGGYDKINMRMAIQNAKSFDHLPENVKAELRGHARDILYNIGFDVRAKGPLSPPDLNLTLQERVAALEGQMNRLITYAVGTPINE